MSKIIVLTPVKNEEWILDKFLTICSLFADHIIIADQNSSDRSAEIALRYEKVILIKNDSDKYDEADRQIKLIKAARDRFGLGNVLVALDADEILAANGLHAKSWDIMRNAKNGTVFSFEKPTLFFDAGETIRYYGDGWPLAYKDDGVEHKPQIIHSTRIPTPDYATRVAVNDIKFLHLCFMRKNIQFSKNRYYNVIENISKVNNLRIRRIMYGQSKPDDLRDEGIIEPTNPEWFKAWDQMGIDIKHFEQQEYYWMDFAVLKTFHKHGTRRFFNDKIWYFDWEKCRNAAILSGETGIPVAALERPSEWRIKTLDAFFHVVYKTFRWKRKLIKK